MSNNYTSAKYLLDNMDKIKSLIKSKQVLVVVEANQDWDASPVPVGISDEE